MAESYIVRRSGGGVEIVRDNDILSINDSYQWGNVDNSSIYRTFASEGFIGADGQSYYTQSSNGVRWWKYSLITKNYTGEFIDRSPGISFDGQSQNFIYTTNSSNNAANAVTKIHKSNLVNAAVSSLAGSSSFGSSLSGTVYETTDGGYVVRGIAGLGGSPSPNGFWKFAPDGSRQYFYYAAQTPSFSLIYVGNNLAVLQSGVTLQFAGTGASAVAFAGNVVHNGFRYITQDNSTSGANANLYLVNSVSNNYFITKMRSNGQILSSRNLGTEQNATLQSIYYLNNNLILLQYATGTYYYDYENNTRLNYSLIPGMSFDPLSPRRILHYNTANSKHLFLANQAHGLKLDFGGNTIQNNGKTYVLSPK
jgi:hypothetical protein